MAIDGRWRGSEPALMTPAPRRRSRWLFNPLNEMRPDDGVTDWRLELDPDNIGVTEGWPEHGLPADAVSVDVPGVWNTIAPGYAGVGWYEARFVLPDWYGRSVQMTFRGSNYQTEAWLNGVYLGCHEGGYDAFLFRCTRAVRVGENRLTLRIVDPPSDSEIDGLRLRECPTAKESWYGGYGGPWDVVRVEASAPVWIEEAQAHGDLPGERARFQVTLASDLDTAVSVEVHVRVSEIGRDSSAAGPRGATLGEAQGTMAVSSTGATVTLTVPVPSPRPWSPESPHRYVWDVAIELPELPPSFAGAMGLRDWDLRDWQLTTPVVDETWGFFGFRTAEWRDGLLYLNGERCFLKGGLLQPTFPRTLARPTKGLSCIEVHQAKQAGLNLIRFHLRPPPIGYLGQCDALGVMAYVEPPLAWIEPSGRLLEHGKREISAMVRACGNHPSVVLWGIFNENAKATEAVGGELMAELARLDPTRPMIENSGGAAVGETGMWAWGGQSRCWSPGWEAPRPLNDVHIYLANPLRREARELLATVGDGPTLDVTPGRARDERIESRLSADAVLVSEYGCGALPDFEAALAAFGEETHLADAVLLRELRDSLAAGLAERGLDREIGDVSSLVQQTQALQAEGIVAQTAALRRNPNVSGLILTQLADAGWEQMAGLVGLWRHPRPALEAFKRALAPRLLHVEMDDPCGRRQLAICVRLIEKTSTQRSTYREGTLDVTVEDPLRPSELGGAHGQGDRGTAHHSSIVVGRRAGGEDVTMTVWLPTEPGRYVLRARIAVDDWEAEATRPILRLPDRVAVTGDGQILVFLASRPSLASLRQAVERARDGAHLCLVGMDPASGKRLEPLLGLPLRMHSGRGNFMGVHHYVREHPLFAGLGAPCLADSTFAEVLPAWVAEELPGAEVLAGCFTVPDGGRGFLWRASVQTLPFGKGRLTLCQLQVGQRLGGALGRHLLERLVGWLR